METDKPRISVLMAVYAPNPEWFREQLQSLNVQTYTNIKLYVRDDCSPRASFEAVRDQVEKYITAFPYEIARNENNLGSNDTFELLTREADGDFFAYCDQDDVWLPEKLSVLEELMEESNAAVACSDMYIIDGSGKRTATGIGEIRRHHVFHAGDNAAPGLLFHNFVTGCTMMAKAELCKAAVPFCPYMIHDHYLALYCAQHGSIAVAPQNLVNYRIHGGNQTSIMAGVVDKESYYQIRIVDYLHRLEWLQEHFDCGEAMKREIADGLTWLRAREKNWRNKGGKRTIWKYRRFSRMPSLYEIFASRFPEPLFKLCLTAAKKNWI